MNENPNRNWDMGADEHKEEEDDQEEEEVAPTQRSYFEDVFHRALDHLITNNGVMSLEMLHELNASGNNYADLYQVYCSAMGFLPEAAEWSPQQTMSQDDLSDAAKQDMNWSMDRLRNGKGFLCRCPLHQPTNITRTRLLENSQILREDLGSSDFGRSFQAHAKYGANRDTMTSMLSLRTGLFHATPSSYVFDFKEDSITAEPIPIVRSFVGDNVLNLGNPCNFYNNRAENGINEFYGPDFNMNAHPSHQLRQSAIYSASQPNMQTVPSAAVLSQDILNPWRYQQQVAMPCAQHNMEFSGLTFLNGLFRLNAIQPSSWLYHWFANTKPHLTNKNCDPDYGNWRQGCLIQHAQGHGLAGRTQYLNHIHYAMKYNFYQMVPVNGLLEEGQHLYGRTDPFTCLYDHSFKADRRMFHTPNEMIFMLDGFQQGCVLHQLHDRDVSVSLWRPMDANGTHRGYVRCCLPVPMHTSYYVIYGGNLRFFSGARFIQYYRYYRPLKVPQMFWFEFDN